MVSELPQRRVRVGVDRADAPAARRAPREFAALETPDDPLLERVLEGLEGAAATRARAGVRSA